MQVGWKDPVSGAEKSFEDWLAIAATNGQAMGFPYEVLLGMANQRRKERPDGLTATMLLGCARAVGLDKLVEYTTDPESDYPAFRGTVGHSMLENNPHPDAVVERRLYRQYRGIEVSGQLDKLRLVIPGAEPGVARYYLEQWLDWCDDMMDWETGRSIGVEPPPPALPRGARFLIEDWKTKHEVPFGNYVYQHHQQQGNLYVWLLRISKDAADVNFVYVSMKGVKVMQLYNGGKYANGREKPSQLWTTEEVEAFLDKRLMVLDAQSRLGKPLPYANVPTDDLWECNYCPVRDLCYKLAAREARQAWQAGQDVDRVPPRDRKAEEKAQVKLPKEKKTR